MERNQDSIILSHDKTFVRAKSIVYYVLGVIEVLLGLRFILKLLGANAQSGFVSMIYGITKSLLIPFLGIFQTTTTNMNSSQSIMEPATLVGMAMYGLIAWGVVKLIEISRIKKNHS